MHDTAPRPCSRRLVSWALPLAVGLIVAAAQLWLVAKAGTDIPFYDQWGVEGRWLYPAWCDGLLRLSDLLKPHNEHHIFWTHLLNLVLFSVNGQWDPLVQMVAVAGLRATCASGLAAALMRGVDPRRRLLVAAGVVGAFLPLLAWHNVLWGFQSQVYFSLGFSLLSLGWLGGGRLSPGRWLAGVAAGIAAQLGMGAGAFVPVALGGLLAVQAVERRRLTNAWWLSASAAAILLALTAGLQVSAPEHAALRAATLPQFLSVLRRCLAWPCPDDPWVALAANLPLGLVIWQRLSRRQAPRQGEDFALMLGFFAMASIVSEAWLRGGGVELSTGVPSRYADFQVLLPIANAWCLGALMLIVPPNWRRLARLGALAWLLVLLAGWLTLSAQMWRGVVQPRMADRDAPVRLVQAFQATGDARLFTGQPRLLVPNPDLKPVWDVLTDRRLRGRLPPSLQPGQPLGLLSALVRWLLAHATAGLWGALAAGLLLVGLRRRINSGSSSGQT